MSNKTEQNLLVTVGGESLSGGVSNKASFTFNSSLLLKGYSLTQNAVLKLLDLDVGRNGIRDQIENFCWFWREGLPKWIKRPGVLKLISNFVVFSTLFDRPSHVAIGRDSPSGTGSEVSQRSCPFGDSNTARSQSHFGASRNKQPNVYVVL